MEWFHLIGDPLNKGSMMSEYIRFLGFAAVCLAIEFTQCKADDSSDRAESSALISAYISNLESLTQYDVLMRYESQFLRADGSIETKTHCSRVLFDAPNQRCLGIMRHSTNRIVPDDKEKQRAQERQQEALNAAVYADGKGWIRSFPGRPFRVGDRSVLKLLGLSGIPAVQLVGLGQFPTPFMNKQHLESTYETLKSETRAFQITPESNGFQQITCDEDEGGVFKIIRTILKMDVDRCVPVSVTRIAVRGKELFPVYREQLKYVEKGGRFLPVKIEGEQSKSSVASDGKRIRGTLIYDVDFKWISVEQPIDDRHLAPEFLKDMTGLMKMVRPELFDEN